MRGPPAGWASGHGSDFVWLLASAHQIVDRFGGFDALFVLKLAYPIRNVGNHVARGFALGITRSFGAHGSFAPLGALYYFDYFFLRHILWGEQVDLCIRLTKSLNECSVFITCSPGKQQLDVHGFVLVVD